MTVPASPYKVSYLADGTKSSYPYTFRIFQGNDLVVQRLDASKNATALTYLTDYTVDGIQSYTGGNVNFTAGNVTAGYTVVIFRNPSVTQQTSLQENGAYSAKAIENALDLNAMQVQAIQDQLNRAPIAPLAEGPTGGTLPIASKRAGTLLGFDVAGNWTTTAQTATLSQSVTVGTIATLKAIATPVAGVVYVVSGYYGSGDGGGGSFYWNVSDVTTDNGGTIIQLNVGGVGRWNRIFEGAVNVRWFGAKGDGVTNDVTSIQAAITCAVTLRAPVRIPASTYKINTGLSLDVAKCGIIGEQAIIDASGMTTGIALALTNSITPAYYQGDISIEGLRFIGPGIGSSVDCISGNATQPSVSRTRISSVMGYNFRRGVVLSDHTWGLNFFACEFWNCADCVYAPGGLTDGGERHTFVGCLFYNSTRGFYQGYNAGSIYFTNCSFDYNGKQGQLDEGKVSLIGCHIEATNYATEGFTIGAGVSGGVLLEIIGGWIQTTGANVNPLINNSGNVHIDGPFINNMGSATNLITGTGRVIWNGNYSYTIHNNPPYVAASLVSLMDGGFEGTSILDAFISSDTAAITSRITGANLALTTSATQSRTGSKSMRMAKTFGSGSACAATLSVPARPGLSYRQEVWYNKPGAETGTVYVNFGWARIEPSGGVPTIMQLSITGSITVTLTGAATGWVKAASGEPIPYCPAWANAAIILIDMGAFVGPGNMYFDDARIDLAP